MKIRYTNDYDDLRLFCNHVMSVSPVLRRQRLIFVISFSVVFFFGATHLAVKSHSYIPYITFAIAGVLILGAFWRKGSKISLKKVQKLYPEGQNKSVVCEHTLELTESGVVDTTPVAQATISIQGVVEVVETTDHWFVFIGTQMAHVIPKAKIIDGNAPLFISELRKKLESQQSDELSS